MKKRHTVLVKEAFEYTHKVGALISGDKEIAPASEFTSTYVAGQKLGFDTKAQAQSFIKFHGDDKVEYIGKE